ncbi:MAG: cupin domain-containing protein [Acidimicrobiia bacterium]|nr:cupin domain-containing protein [Acidimicrobiia bacterium]
MNVRRVVTGHDDRGKAVVVSDEQIEPITVSVAPGSEFVSLWGSDEPQTYPDSGENPAPKQWFPPLAGFRFVIFTVPPEGPAELPEDMEAAVAEMDARLPGMVATLDMDDLGMHTSDTTDFVVVLAGELVLELDEGAEVMLRPGDTVIQSGTRHRWRNPGSVQAVAAGAMVGAHRNNE